MRSKIVGIVAILCTFVVLAAGQTKATQTKTSPAKTSPTKTNGAKKAKLMKPESMIEKAPATFKADFGLGNGGHFVIEVHRDWDPSGADRFYNLVKNGFYDDCRFFRVVPKFMVQFGLNGDPAVTSAWTNAKIKDEPVKQGNKRGYVSFAKPGAPDSRTTQIFINFVDNAFLDGSGFSAFGQVTTGMEAVDKINSEYGEQPQQGMIQSQGNVYLNKEFPKLDFVKKATIVK